MAPGPGCSPPLVPAGRRWEVLGAATQPYVRVRWGAPAAGKVNGARPHFEGTLGPRATWPVKQTHLAHGLIFRASPRLMQKPAPPVANQKWTGRCGRGSVVRPPGPGCGDPLGPRPASSGAWTHASPSYSRRPSPWPGWACPGWACRCTRPGSAGSWPAGAAGPARSRSCRRPRGRTTWG